MTMFGIPRMMAYVFAEPLVEGALVSAQLIPK
jgi:hypothetical protein